MHQSERHRDRAGARPRRTQGRTASRDFPQVTRVHYLDRPLHHRNERIRIACRIRAARARRGWTRSRSALASCRSRRNCARRRRRSLSGSASGSASGFASGSGVSGSGPGPAPSPAPSSGLGPGFDPEAREGPEAGGYSLGSGGGSKASAPAASPGIPGVPGVFFGSGIGHTTPRLGPCVPTFPRRPGPAPPRGSPRPLCRARHRPGYC
uniref:Tsr2 n=1 Tax=Streptomyces laurentii TaxID=39478 RepID=C0JRX7_STRLU|nr:Tsr2 [Streptomyces laurentii]